MEVETAPAGRAPVMADVARAAGVSLKTVSRVVNDAPHVREDVRRRVAEAIDSLGYRPNVAARALVTQRTRVIGVAMPGSALYGPSAQLFGVETAAWEQGYSVVVASAVDGSNADVGRAVQRLLDQGVDGIVVSDPYVDHGLSPSMLNRVPTVSVGDQLPEDLVCPAVMVDQEDGSRQAVEHLLGLGHRTVHHLAGPATWQSAARRATGWRAALEAAGAPVPEPLAGDWSARSGYELGVVLAADPAVTAVFAANDQMAVGAMRAFAEAGRRIPADVSVVGFDDIPDAAYQIVPLTTVRQDFTVVARRAVENLLQSIEGRQSVEDLVRIPVDLVVRESSGPAPAATRPD